MWFGKVKSGTETRRLQREEIRAMEQSGLGEEDFLASQGKELQGLWSLEDAN